MNKIFLTILFFQCVTVFSQKIKIDKKDIIPKESDFKGYVKKITLNTFELKHNTDNVDTTKTIHQINFSKNGKIEKLFSYNATLKNLNSISEFDNFERIISFSRKKNDIMQNYIKQYFSNKTDYPDSTITYYNDSYVEKYKNYFKNEIIIKQEKFVNNKLIDYRIFSYNSNNQIIEDLYLNLENDTDETIVSKSENEFTVYPERLTNYEYKIVKDTLFEIKIRPKFNLKEITKVIKTKKYFLKIIEKYDNEILENSELNFTFKDSLIRTYTNYDVKKEIQYYSKTTTTDKSIISEWKFKNYENNKSGIEILKIEKVYDKQNNWIKKSYFRDNKVLKFFEREIEYF